MRRAKVTSLLVVGYLCFFLEQYPVSATYLSNNTINDAVDQWENDPNTAQLTYGHISLWDISKVTSLELSECWEEKRVRKRLPGLGEMCYLGGV